MVAGLIVTVTTLSIQMVHNSSTKKKKLYYYDMLIILYVLNLKISSTYYLNSPDTLSIYFNICIILN